MVQQLQFLISEARLDKVINDVGVPFTSGWDCGVVAFEFQVSGGQVPPCACQPLWGGNGTIDVKVQIPEGGGRTNLNLQCLSPFPQHVTCGSIQVIVFHVGIDMFRQLGYPRVLDVQALGLKGAIDQIPGHPFLDMDLVQGDFQDGSHDFGEIFLGQSGGNQGVLNGFHDCAIEDIPTIFILELFATDSVPPGLSLGPEVGNLVIHVAIRTGECSKGFLTGVAFQAGDNSRGTSIRVR